MSALLGNGTLANLNTAYYSGGGGGGGGGGPVISTVVVNASTLAVSSITASGPGQSLNFPNGFEMPAGAAIILAGGGAPSAGDIEFSNSNGQLVGVSTINGAAYTPAPKSSKITLPGSGNYYVPATGANTNLASFSTTALHLYRLGIPYLRVQNQPAAVPAAGAWCDLSIDTAVSITYLDTFDMASVSTIANDLNKAPVYTFVASGANHTLTATGSLANTVSTAITLGGPMWLEDLGLITSFPNAN